MDDSPTAAAEPQLQVKAEDSTELPAANGNDSVQVKFEVGISSGNQPPVTNGHSASTAIDLTSQSLHSDSNATSALDVTSSTDAANGAGKRRIVPEMIGAVTSSVYPASDSLLMAAESESESENESDTVLRVLPPGVSPTDSDIRVKHEQNHSTDSADYATAVNAQIQTQEFEAATASTLLQYEVLPIERQYLPEFSNHTSFYLDLRNTILGVWHENVCRYLTFDVAYKSGRIARRFKQAAERVYIFLDQFGHINTGLLRPQQKPQATRQLHQKYCAVNSRTAQPAAANGHNGHTAAAPADDTHSRNILVIGAGASGLSAARQLQSFGHKVTVLESRSRPGGRVYTDTKTFSAPVDCGASIIVGLEANPLTVLCRQYNQHPTVNNTIETYNNILCPIRESCPIYDSEGKQVDALFDAKCDSDHNLLVDATDYMRRALDCTSDGVLDAGEAENNAVRNKLLSLPTLPNLCTGLTKEQLLEMDFETGIKLAEQRLELTFSKHEQGVLDWYVANVEYGVAAPISKVSLVHWDQDDHSFLIAGPHALLRRGFVTLIEKLCEDVDIRYDTIVNSIDYTADGVTVHTTNSATQQQHAYTADQVLCTVSLGVLKRSVPIVDQPPDPTGIVFNPPLPEWKAAAIQRLGFGLLNKLILEFDEVFWSPDTAMIGNVNTEERGMYYIFWNLYPATGRPILVALAAGTAAHVFETIAPQEHVKAAVATLTRMFGADTVTPPIRHHCTSWSTDPYARGSYSYITVGSTGDDYDLLAKPVSDRLFFAGEACNRYQPATVPGAIISGLRAAGMIEQCFKQLPTELPSIYADRADNYNPTADVNHKLTTAEEEHLIAERRKWHEEKMKQLWGDQRVSPLKQLKRGWKPQSHVDQFLLAERAAIAEAKTLMETEKLQVEDAVRNKLSATASMLLLGNNDYSSDPSASPPENVSDTPGWSVDKAITQHFVRYSGEPVESLFTKSKAPAAAELPAFKQFDEDDLKSSSRSSDKSKKRSKSSKHGRDQGDKQQRHAEANRRAEELAKKADLSAASLSQSADSVTSSATASLPDFSSPIDSVTSSTASSFSAEAKHEITSTVKALLKRYQSKLSSDDFKLIYKKTVTKIVDDWKSKDRGSTDVKEWLSGKRRKNIKELLEKYVAKFGSSVPVRASAADADDSMALDDASVTSSQHSHNGSGRVRSYASTNGHSVAPPDSNRSPQYSHHSPVKYQTAVRRTFDAQSASMPVAPAPMQLDVPPASVPGLLSPPNPARRKAGFGTLEKSASSEPLNPLPQNGHANRS